MAGAGAGNSENRAIAPEPSQDSWSLKVATVLGSSPKVPGYKFRSLGWRFRPLWEPLLYHVVSVGAQGQPVSPSSFTSTLLPFLHFLFHSFPLSSLSLCSLCSLPLYSVFLSSPFFLPGESRVRNASTLVKCTGTQRYRQGLLWWQRAEHGVWQAPDSSVTWFAHLFRQSTLFTAEGDWTGPPSELPGIHGMSQSGGTRWGQAGGCWASPAALSGSMGADPQG